jgi:hypothetical protein
MTYIPSVGINIKFTALFTSPVSGTTQYIGYGSSTDGLFFGYNGTSFGVVIRNNSVDTFISQSSWNVDKFNGTGISQINLNPLLGNVYEIKFQWLEFGSIFFSIENPNLGEFVLVHIIKYANTSLVTSINYPNGYLWVETKNGSTSNNMIIKTPSLSMVYEGIVSDTYGIKNTYYSNKVNVTRTTNDKNFITLRNKTIHQSKINIIPIKILILAGANQSGGTTFVTIFKNPTLSATPVYSDYSTNSSIVELSTDTNITVTSTSGKLQHYSIASTGNFGQNLEFLDLIIYPGEVFTVATNHFQPTNNMYMTVTWVENL